MLGQEFGLRIELKPGVMPMLETMIFRFLWRHHLANDLLDPVHQFVGQLEARACRRLEVEHELPRVRPWKIGAPDEWIEAQAEHKQSDNRQHCQEGPL